MTAIILSAENLQTVKRGLREFFPEAKSSHLTEALAASVGRRTHAALLADLAKADPADPVITLIDQEAFLARARELGFDPPQEDIEWGIFPLGVPSADQIFIDTIPSSGWDIEYTSLRDRAWRNMMVAATNAAIEQKLFSVRPGDNRWPGWDQKATHVFSFTFGADIPALGSVYDVGFDEIAIHVGLWPTARGEELIDAWSAGFHAGEAFATGWLERKNGAYLQSNTTSLKCRQKRLRTVAEVDIKPKCFGDRGKLIM